MLPTLDTTEEAGGTRTVTCTRTLIAPAPPYPSLPVCPPLQPQEPMPAYAARCLTFLLAESVTATMSDEQLRQADSAAQRAVSQVRAEDGTASRLNTAELLTLERLTSTRHLIAQVLAWRENQHREACTPAGGTILPVGGTQGGRTASLQPAPPSLPPGNAYALPQPPAVRRF